MKRKTTLLLVAVWVAGGLAFEAGVWRGRIERQIAKMQQQATNEKQQAVERERAVGDRNLHQAERFIIMCLDPALKYAYLGDMIVECRARVTNQKTTL